jgi:hypothetical protein
MGGKQQNRGRRREQHRQKRQKRRQEKLGRSQHPKTQQRWPAREEVGMPREFKRIIRLAQDGEECIVRQGDLICFSSQSGDAWLLDPQDGLALCLARDGERQPNAVRETSSGFAVEWTGRFTIDGESFVVIEETGRSRAILGYPTRQIAACYRTVREGQFPRLVLSGTREEGTDNPPALSTLPSGQLTAEAALADATTTDGGPAKARIDWALATVGVPTEDLLSGLDLAKPGDLAEAIASLTSMIEHGDYLAWEAVVRQEQGLPLSEVHESQLDELFSFVDDENEEDDEERILYINGFARPVEPWYKTARRLAPRLLLPVVHTDDVWRDVDLEGWQTLRAALKNHASGLSLPQGTATPLEVVPAELSHRLDLQDSLMLLVGIGQEHSGGGRTTLRDPGQLWRVDEFIENLGAIRESVACLGLSLVSLREILVMPATEREILETLLREKLHLGSDTEFIAEHLVAYRTP